MIRTYSRYYTGPLVQDTGVNERTLKTDIVISVWRKFPKTREVKLAGYIWKDGDSWSELSAGIYGDPNSYYRLLDLNPEIMDPWRMEPGMAIWIPNV